MKGNTMLDKIENTKDIRIFIDYLFDNKINFHWDDDFSDYVDNNGNKSFSNEEAARLNSLMEQSLNVDFEFVELYTINKLDGLDYPLEDK